MTILQASIGNPAGSDLGKDLLQVQIDIFSYREGDGRLGRSRINSPLLLTKGEYNQIPDKEGVKAVEDGKGVLQAERATDETGDGLLVSPGARDILASQALNGSKERIETEKKEK